MCHTVLEFFLQSRSCPQAGDLLRKLNTSRGKSVLKYIGVQTLVRRVPAGTRLSTLPKKNLNPTTSGSPGQVCTPLS